jgi:GNAT superfamily N-acetyltransferase
MIDVAPFAPGHATGVASLIVPIQREEFGIPISLADQPDLADIPGFYQRGAGNFWVALHAGDVVGSIALLDIGNGQGALRKMFVAPAFRGREHGTATRLLDALLAWSRSRGLRDVFLGTTAQFLAAHRFYEKNGFREIERHELPATFPVMTVDTKFYVRSIGEPSA